MLTPTLVLRDPEVIKQVLLKDFEYFHQRVFYFKEDKDPLAANLFTVGGSRWKTMRTKLNPGFTPSKMRLMFSTMVNTTDQLVYHIESLGEIVEIKDIFKRFTMDVIASIAFGIETNCLKDSDNDFIRWGNKVFEATPLSGLRNFINFVLPKLASIIYIPFFSKEITDHFCGLVWSTIDYRNKHSIKRNDFMQMLMQLREKGYIDDDENPSATRNVDITAQAVIFFTAGFETTATSLSFCIHELAMNSSVQARLYDEVCCVLDKHDGNVTKYPPGAILTRKCCKDFVLPGSDNVVLEAGTPIIVPILGLHHDPRYFPDPDNFNPERFSEENKNSISPYVYLPFGGGPRNCIAARFAMMEMKVAIAVLLKKYEIQPCSTTVHPLTFDPRAFVLSSISGMFLQFSKRM
ncbi:Cytochrome P450 6k1 [Blattella germanica]|nr:Cytochrome P450 6k1 [Blattella germanica]